MIKDKLEHAKTYYGISENFKKGFEWLKNNDLDTLTEGRHGIDGDNIYANIQSYETKDSAPYEAHREYADIQFMIKGEERIGVTDYSNCTVTETYNKGKDIEFLSLDKEDFFETIKEGEFLVLFPQDAHKPSINPDKKQHVKKVVVKIKL